MRKDKIWQIHEWETIEMKHNERKADERTWIRNEVESEEKETR